MAIDGLDRKILEHLRADARLSYREVARRVGSTTPTVIARVRRMEELDIIQGYTVRLDPDVFGAPDDHTVDLDAEVRLTCHTCGKATGHPEWWSGDGRRHPFCCPTCRRQFVERYEAAAEGL